MEDDIERDIEKAIEHDIERGQGGAMVDNLLIETGFNFLLETDDVLKLE